MEGAKLLAGGHGFVHPFVWLNGVHDAATAGHPPLWIAVLAVPATLGIDGYDVARVAGALAGTAAVVVIGLAGRRLAGERAGIVAAAVAATYPAWVVADGSGMSEALYLLLVAAVVWGLLAEGPAWAIGVAVGLAALARTEGLFLLPFAVWPLLWRRWRPLAVATVSAAVVVVPWTIRNAVELDRFVPVSTNTETVIAGANCHGAWYGRDTGLWLPDCLHRASGQVDLATGYDEGALAGRWRRSGLDYAGEHPGRLAVVLTVRMLRTWRLWQPLREGEMTEGVDPDAAKVGALWFLVLILPFGLYALARGPLRREHRRLFAGLALMVTLTSALGWGGPRFLRPAELALILAAAAYVALTRAVPSGARPSRPT